MNGWLKIALYSFIGIIIGSFILGLIAPNGGAGMYQGRTNTPNGGYYNHGNGMGSMMEGMPRWNGR